MIGVIERRDVAAFTAVGLTTRGPYWKLSGAFARIRTWLTEAGLEPTGAGLGIFYDDPACVPSADTRYSVCYPIDTSALENAQRALGSAGALGPTEAAARVPPHGDLISLVEFPAASAAVVEYEGPAAGSPDVYERLRSWIELAGYERQGPPREIYIAEPGTLTAGLMHVEVQQPLAAVTAPGG
jgi:effector-binding domain-containing protein